MPSHSKQHALLVPIGLAIVIGSLAGGALLIETAQQTAQHQIEARPVASTAPDPASASDRHRDVMILAARAALLDPELDGTTSLDRIGANSELDDAAAP